MQNKITLLTYFVLVAFLVSGCDKKETKPYSRWTVNGEEFTTNEVVAAAGKTQAGMSSQDAGNRFQVTFTIGELPRSGTYDLNMAVPGQMCVINFYYHGQLYYSSPAQIGKVEAYEVKHKARYVLSPTWFVNAARPQTDSVLISGEFNEP